MLKSRQQGFTLAELLSVLVIIAIVLSIALPAVTNLTKASALSSAARHVPNTLSLARQYAITHRTTTRVVFPYSATANVSLSPGTNQAPIYVSYAVVATNAQAGTISYLTKWESLPVGAVFLNSSSTAGALDNTSSLLRELMPFPYWNSARAWLAYIEFGPTGAATQTSTLTSTLTIQGGFIDNNGLPQPTTPHNSVTNVVDNIVGRIQVIHP